MGTYMCTSTPTNHKSITRAKKLMTRQHTQICIFTILHGIIISHPYVIGDLLYYMNVRGKTIFHQDVNKEKKLPYSK